MIGPLLFNQNIIVRLTYVIVFVIDVMLIRSQCGLRTRAVSEARKAADTVDINMVWLCYKNAIRNCRCRAYHRIGPFLQEEYNLLAGVHCACSVDL